MPDTIFLQIFDMTKVASLVILVVLVVRLCLKRAPKVFSYALWAVVLFRLLCPVSIEAPISLIPQTEPTVESYDLLNEPITPIAAIDAAQQAVGDVLNGGIGIQHVRTTDVDTDGTARIISTDFANVWMLFGKYVWLAGIAVMLVYSGISCIKLRRKLLASIKVRNNIYIADHIDTPFVMGIFRPKIYLPSSLSEKERGYIILHEQHHIRRGDHIIKLLSFAALCLHWFNPLVWAAFILSGKDMEMSCDEAVLRKLGGDIRVDYSASLISLATGRRIIAGTPLAFGEGNTEGRIKNIARWKKSAVWVIVIAVIVCAAVAVCLITNPMNRDTQFWGAEYRIDEILYRTSDEFDSVDNDSASICITADYCFYVRGSEGSWDFVGKMEPYTLDKDELVGYTANDDGWLQHYNPGEITESYIMRMNVTESEAQLYLAFKTKRGDTLLGVGVEDLSERGQGASDDTLLHVLLRLESTFDSDGRTGMFLERSLAGTVSEDVDIFFNTNVDIPGYIIVCFEADGTTDFGFALFAHNDDESGYRLMQYHVYKDIELANTEVFTCPDLAVMDVGGVIKQKKTYARVEFRRHLTDDSAAGFAVRVTVLTNDEVNTGNDEADISSSDKSPLVDLDKPEVSIDTGNIIHITYSEEMTEISRLAELINTVDLEKAAYYDSHWDVNYEEELNQMLTIGTDDDTAHITYIFLTYGKDSGKCVFSRIITDKSTDTKTETVCFAFEDTKIHNQIEKAAEQAASFAY